MSVPIAAPSESSDAAACRPESHQDNSIAELSSYPLSAAPLLHPQRQRELIEQAAGMSTRQVTGLLAAAGPEVVPPRDTLRAVAPDRFTLKVSIDQECEQGLRLLKGLLSHRDPRMSWGDLVARVVREAVARHDPRGGGSGQRGRHNAGSAGASPRRTPNKTRAAGAAAGPAQRANESSRRAPHRTRAAGAPAQRGSDTPAPEEKRTGRVAAPALPAQCACGATGAPHADAAGAGRRNPIAIVANAAAPRQSAPAAPADTPRGWRSNPHGATFPRLSGATSGNDKGRCVYRDPLSGRRCNSSHLLQIDLLQIDHLLPVAQGGGPDPNNLALRCFAHDRLRHGYGPAPPPERPM